MFTRPPLLPVLVGIWLVPLILGLMLDPFGGVTFFLPRPAEAAFRLREAAYFDRGSHCASGSQIAWREVLAGPHAESWYRAIADDAYSPAGQLYGLIGLYAIDSTSLDSLAWPYEGRLTTDSVIVVADDTVGWMSPLEMLRPNTVDSIVTVFRDAHPRPEC